MKKVFKMNGKEFPSMMALARELEIKRVYPKDFEKYGITAIEVEKMEAKEAATVENKKEETPDKDDMLDANYPGVSDEEENTEDAEEKEEEKPKRKSRRQKREKKEKEITPEMMEQAEKLQEKAGYENIREWALDMKSRNREEVYELAKDLGIAWDVHESPRVNRMRAVSAIRETLYPGQKRPRVRRSEWRGIEDTKVEELIKENELDDPKHDNPAITRMLRIKLLKKAGVKVPK